MLSLAMGKPHLLNSYLAVLTMMSLFGDRQQNPKRYDVIQMTSILWMM